VAQRGADPIPKGNSTSRENEKGIAGDINGPEKCQKPKSCSSRRVQDPGVGGSSGERRAEIGEVDQRWEGVVEFIDLMQTVCSKGACGNA